MHVQWPEVTYSKFCYLIILTLTLTLTLTPPITVFIDTFAAH